jgi:hypothetical protein
MHEFYQTALTQIKVIASRAAKSLLPRSTLSPQRFLKDFSVFSVLSVVSESAQLFSLCIPVIILKSGFLSIACANIRQYNLTYDTRT